jgi:transposase
MDVHKKVVVVCALVKRRRLSRSFGTTTAELKELCDWLVSLGVTHAAMESTGSYWKPVFNLLEGSGVEPMVVNAAHVKGVPGRKTDMNDAQWLADLLRHGLLRASFIPDRGQRELRELVRYRRSLVQEQAREVLRIHKVLEGANIKLASVVSNVMGVSGRAMLEALAEGVEDTEELTGLARGRLKAKREQLLVALEGLIGDHQRFLLKEQLRHVEELEERIDRLSKEIARRMRPFESQIRALDEVPGVGRRGAEEIIAETGIDMSRFPTSRHISSWAKVSPGNNESAGKRRSGRTGRGNPWLRSTLVEAAVASVRTKNSYLSAQFRRIAARRGKKRAAMAVAHSLLVIAYHILRDGVAYRDLGHDFFDRRSKDALASRMKRRLESLGYTVTLEEAA